MLRLRLVGRSVAGAGTAVVALLADMLAVPWADELVEVRGRRCRALRGRWRRVQ